MINRSGKTTSQIALELAKRELEDLEKALERRKVRSGSSSSGLRSNTSADKKENSELILAAD
jgi:hypothetical protein